jgi:DNA-binding XRE family transcriptional regulator
VYREKINSMDEVYAKGYCPEPTEPPILCYVEDYLKSRGLTISELSEKTGISRQTMHNILKGVYTPGVDLALKIGHVLGVSVESLFELTDAAWVSRAKLRGERSLYLDILNLVLLDKEAIEEEMKADPAIYYDRKTKQMLTPEEKEAIEKQELEETLRNPKKIDRLIGEEESVDKRSIPRIVREALEEEHRDRFVPKYQKLVRRIPR